MSAVARLASSRGAAPRAQVWFLHSGDARSRSTRPISPLNAPRSTSSKRLVTTWASGKLAAYVPVAMGQQSIPATISEPAARAPALLPPAPQKMSRVRIMLRFRRRGVRHPHQDKR